MKGTAMIVRPRGNGMQSPSKHLTKSRLAGKVVITLNKTIPVKLNGHCVNEIRHLPCRKETKFHDNLQDIHPFCKDALNCKLAALCKHYCSQTKDERFLPS